MTANNDDDDGAPRDSRRPALIGLLVVAALVVVAYLVIVALHKQGQMEDCLMSGRTNCAPINVPNPNR